MPDAEYEAREQSAIKHFVLQQYLAAATRILGSTREFRYVDCCAGPWQSRSLDYSDTSFGIALAELAKSAEHLSQRNIKLNARSLMIERRKLAFGKLDLFIKEQAAKGVRVAARNWDFSKRIPDIVKFASAPNSFPFIFIDPKGWKLAGIPTIADILKVQPGEVLINFMSSFVTRFVNSPGAGLDKLLGGDISHLRNLSGHDLEAALMQHYCEQIRRVGNYKYVCVLPVMKPRSEAIHFHLVYATRHAKGVEVFKDVERKTETLTRSIRAEVQKLERDQRPGSGELFEPMAYYREDRYIKVVQSNKQAAKLSLIQLLSSKQPVLYRDCWGPALQFAGIHEKDLRSWLGSLESRGLIVITGRIRAKEVLKRESDQKITQLCEHLTLESF